MRGETKSLAEMMALAREKLAKQLAEGTEYIPPAPTCGTCLDTGYVRFEIEDHRDPRFGKLQPCPACGQTKQTVAQVDLSGLHPSERVLSWDNILTLQGHNVNEGTRAVQRALHRGHGWVYLWGGYGLGKTLILKVAVSRALQRGVDAMYIKAERMLDMLRDSYKNDTFERTYDTFVKVPVLALEEFEKVSRSEWAEVKLFNILDDRYDRATRFGDAAEGVTLFAANLAPHLIDDLALRSRISDERFARVQLTGGDVRPASKQLHQ